MAGRDPARLFDPHDDSPVLVAPLDDALDPAATPVLVGGHALDARRGADGVAGLDRGGQGDPPPAMRDSSTRIGGRPDGRLGEADHDGRGEGAQDERLTERPTRRPMGVAMDVAGVIGQPGQARMLIRAEGATAGVRDG